MLVTRATFVLLLVSVGVLQAAPLCTIGTLASYEALGSGGCMDGQLLVKDFAFSVITSGGTASPATDSTITVTPTSTAPGTFGLSLSTAGPGFTVSGTGLVKYLVAYTWDPRNIRSMDDLLDIAVAPPGLVKVTTDGCVGAAFIGSVCSTFVDTVTVSDDGITPVLFDKVSFAPPVVSILGIRTTIELDGNTTGSASFADISNESSIPEPATWVSAGVCLCALLMRSRSRRGPQTRLIAGQMALDRSS